MEHEQLKRIVKNQMPERRWEHTLGVVETSFRLAKQYGADPEKAELAAILHDYAKYWPIEAQQQIIETEGISLELLKYDKQLLHAHAGAYVVQRDLAIDDEEVLNAIRYHTSGRENMSLLEKIVCLADYMEPGRSYPGVERIRQLADGNLESALIAGFDSTIEFLIEKKKKIFPLTILARNDLIQKLLGG